MVGYNDFSTYFVSFSAEIYLWLFYVCYSSFFFLSNIFFLSSKLFLAYSEFLPHTWRARCHLTSNAFGKAINSVLPENCSIHFQINWQAFCPLHVRMVAGNNICVIDHIRNRFSKRWLLGSGNQWDFYGF